jgi:hypothetical protein
VDVAADTHASAKPQSRYAQATECAVGKDKRFEKKRQ